MDDARIEPAITKDKAEIDEISARAEDVRCRMLLAVQQADADRKGTVQKSMNELNFAMSVSVPDPAAADADRRVSVWSEDEMRVLKDKMLELVRKL